MSVLAPAVGALWLLAAPVSLSPPVQPQPIVRRSTQGFVDAHAHPASLGRSLARLDLRDTPSLAAVQRAVAQASAEGSGWLVGRGWDQNDWSDHQGFPTAAQLDAHSNGRPVVLSRIDGHAAWLNSAALAALQITADTPESPGGRILRGPDGAPTGVLIDTAMDLIQLPETPPDEARRQLQAGLAAIAATGLTGVHAMGVSDANLAHYEALDDERALQIRIMAYLSSEGTAREGLEREGPRCGRRLCVVGVKMFADGALGSRGAYLSADYSDEPGHRGAPIASQAELAAAAIALLRVDAQLAVHAIGDAGVSMTLDAFAEARAAVPSKAHIPLRLEHAQVVRPEDIPRMKALNVVASMQPTHATSDMPWVPARLGPERVPWSYAWRDMLDAGLVLALGSDFPVERVDPGLGIWAATTRSDDHGQPAGGWRMDQALSFDEATHGFTAATWDALGDARPGFSMPSDDHTFWASEPGPGGAQRWRAVKTVVGGKTVWEAPD